MAQTSRDQGCWLQYDHLPSPFSLKYVCTKTLAAEIRCRDFSLLSASSHRGPALFASLGRGHGRARGERLRAHRAACAGPVIGCTHIQQSPHSRACAVLAPARAGGPPACSPASVCGVREAASGGRDGGLRGERGHHPSLVRLFSFSIFSFSHQLGAAPPRAVNVAGPLCRSGRVMAQLRPLPPSPQSARDLRPRRAASFTCASGTVPPERP